MSGRIYFIIAGLMLVLLTFSCQQRERKANFENVLQNTQWIVHAGGLIAPDGDSSYYLSARVASAAFLNFYAIEFVDGDKFRSYDSWECGNDCFTEVYGRYYFTKAKQIEMEVDSIITSGTCQAPTQVFKPSKHMTFDLEKEGERLKLTRQ